MDDTANQQANQSQRDNASMPQNDQQQQPVGIPVGGKEHEARSMTPDYRVIQPTEAEPEVPAEVAEAGVESVASHERPHIPDQAKQVGMTHAGPTHPVSSEPTLGIAMPTSVKQAEQALKATKANDSRSWLLSVMLKLLKKEEKK